MTENQRRLSVMNGEELMNANIPPMKYCVETLLPQGLCMLAGAPKIGKSWLALDLALHVAKGEPRWSRSTVQGTALYLGLEDSFRRMQERLRNIAENVPDNIFLAVQAGTLAEGLCEQISDFKEKYVDLSLVIIDTFQLIRRRGNDVSYTNGYEELRMVKELADRLEITVLLIHHLRKMGDSDPLNKISGSTGISGAVDAVFILDRVQRGQADASLECTGRDIPSRRLDLKFGKKIHIWELISDSLEEPEILLPEKVAKLIPFMEREKLFAGSNTDFTDRFNADAGTDLSPKVLKQLMQQYRYQLENHGIRFQSHRSNGQRLLRVEYIPFASDCSDASDVPNTVCEICVPCDPDTENTDVGCP